MAEHREPEAFRVAERLRNDIFDGRRLPGSKLVEREIAAELDVSRVPVRDALKMLVAEGLVTLRPRTWAVVRQLEPSDVADLQEVRESMEVLAFRLAAQRHTRENLEELRRVVEGEQSASARGDVVTARRLAADFHEHIIELAGNRMLSEIWQLMRSRMRWYLVQHDDTAMVAEQHAQLFDAVALRDLPRVEQLAAKHIADEQLAAQRDSARAHGV